ncbi:MAG: VWA domain-containing protein [Pseudomonadota bacterium]
MRDLAQEAPFPRGEGNDDGRRGAETWWWACLAIDVLARAGRETGGVIGGAVLRGGPGPARDAWIARLVEATGRSCHRLPMGCPPSRLGRGVDLVSVLAGGRPVETPGVVARAAGGILLVPGAEAMEPRLAAQLISALSEVAPDQRPLIIAFDERSSGDDEGGPPPALTEHLGLTVPLAGVALADLDASEPLAMPVEGKTTAPPTAPPTAALVGPLVVTAASMGIVSLRPVLQAVAAAGALAALDGRAIAEEEDLAAATRLVLLPRARYLPAPEDSAPPEPEQPEPEQPEPEPEPEAQSDHPDETDADPPDDPPPDPAAMQELAERVLEAAIAALPPDMLSALAGRAPRRPARAGRDGPSRKSPMRGRPVGTRPGMPEGGRRLALVETMMAAAPWQRLRGRRAGGRLHIRRGDLRIQRQSAPVETLTVFVVDASGSTAFARLAEAKGAVEILLGEAYRRRDQVALVSFRGPGGEVLLPPTRALARARRLLAGLPGGGATPLAAGIDTAVALGARARRDGLRVQTVLLTDGRGNIARDGTPGRTAATADALQAAAALGDSGSGVLVIDTGARPARQAVALAEAANGRYLALPGADAARIAKAARDTGAAG